MASEQPDLWGALTNKNSSEFLLQAIKYFSGADIVKVEDTLARVARLRPTTISCGPSYHASGLDLTVLTGFLVG